MGKNIGDDLREGKATLPLIAAMQHSSEADAAIVRHAIEQGSTDALAQVIEVVGKSGALEVARQAAQAEAQRAIDAISVLPASEYRSALIQLGTQLLSRRA
jgi:octaprenyl-diphosphate synthase